MQKYVNQLVEILQEAHGNCPAPRPLFLPDDMKGLEDIIDMEMAMEEEEKTMESIFGIPQIYFPPENRLSDEQILQLKAAILELWRVFHYEADFRKHEFAEREQYTKLVEKWNETCPIFRGSNGTWHIEMYDYEQYWDEKKRCYVSEDEYFKNLPQSFDFSDEEETPF